MPSSVSDIASHRRPFETYDSLFLPTTQGHAFAPNDGLIAVRELREVLLQIARVDDPPVEFRLKVRKADDVFLDGIVLPISATSTVASPRTNGRFLLTSSHGVCSHHESLRGNSATSPATLGASPSRPLRSVVLPDATGPISIAKRPLGTDRSILFRVGRPSAVQEKLALQVSMAFTSRSGIAVNAAPRVLRSISSSSMSWFWPRTTRFTLGTR